MFLRSIESQKINFRENIVFNSLKVKIVYLMVYLKRKMQYTAKSLSQVHGERIPLGKLFFFFYFHLFPNPSLNATHRHLLLVAFLFGIISWCIPRLI